MAFTEEELLEFRTGEFIHRFSEWKRVLKGETLWPHPVSIVPKYPLDLFDLPKPTHVPDLDKEAPGMMAVNRFLVSLGLGTPIPQGEPLFGSFETPDTPETKPIDPVELQIQFSEIPKTTRGQWEALFKNLAECRQVSFELVARDSKVVVQFVCDETERLLVRSCLAEAFPGVIIREEREYLTLHFWGIKNAACVIHEYGLANDCAFPLKIWQPHEDDPLTPIVDILLSLGSDECGVFQVSFAVADWWRNNLAGLCLDNAPVPFSRVFGNKAKPGPAKQKITRPFVGAVVRVGLRTSPERAEEIFRSLDACFRFEQSGINFLYRLPNRSEERRTWRSENSMLQTRGEVLIYDATEHQLHTGKRQSQRSGMLLSHDELFSLVHLPLERLGKSRLKLLLPHAKSAPKQYLIPESGMPGDGRLLGINEYKDGNTGVFVGAEERSRHTYVIGVSGTGKSTLLLGMILQDIVSGGGVAVLDPHGDLIEKVLEYLPEKRKDDVVLFDPSDEEYPIGFNILAAHSDAEKNLLANDLVAVFRRLSTTWGDQMNTVFVNAILAFLESSQGGTLVDLRNFLVDKEYRLKFLETVQDEGVRYYWTKEFPMLTGKPQGPILTRLDAFLRPKMIRNMVSQKENKLDFSALMNQKKIVLAKLTHGAIGPEDSYLFGSLLVAKFQQAAFGRQNMPQAERSLFNLYIDEFHNFVTPSVASILSGGRKYGLGLTLAHQELRQLWSRDEQVASAVLANPATRICFRVGDWDAHKLAEGFTFFKAKDIQSLGKGDAICRIDTADSDFNMSTIPWEFLLDSGEDKEARKERIRASSRERYATPRAMIGGVREQQQKVMPEEFSAVQPAPIPEAPRSVPEKEAFPPLAKKSKAPVSTSQQANPGKGGRQHKYLQDFFKRQAEICGYFGEIEKSVLNGVGSIDLSLEGGGKKIACEISVTTTAEHEMKNAQKCLASGYDFVALVSPNKATLASIRNLAGTLEEALRARLRIFAPGEFLVFLKEQAVGNISTENIVRGKKVRVNYKAPSAGQLKEINKNIGQIIAASLKRLGED